MIAGILIFVLVCGVSMAADYPRRPITLVNPSAPGGSNDVIGRIFAAHAEKYLGKPMVLVNKTGGKGIIATLYCRKARPDGYTLMLNTASRSAVVSEAIATGKEAPYRWNQFIPLGTVTNSPSMLCVPYDSPWQNVNEFVAAAKAQPEHYKFCSSGLYGGSHMPMALVMQATGIKFRHVAYHGGGPCLQATLGGHFDFTTQFPSTTGALVRAKKLRWLATTAPERLRLLPDVPTLKEQGINAVYTMWIGFFAQLKTPEPIVKKLQDVVYKVAHDPKFIETVQNVGNEVYYMSPDEQMKYITAEVENYTKVISEMEKAKKK